ncbi:MAG: hypothetical protein EXR72_26535 [Myxococcales bacterium]|nr:hypothetical protein [Myxococcales bacterium]
MKPWLRVSALVKIVFFEFIAVFCLAAATGGYLRTHGVLGCPPEGTLGASGVFFVLAGLASAAWLLWRTAWPRELDLDFRPNLKLGPIIVSNPLIKTAFFKFSTTHPSYVFVDLLVLASVYPLYVAGEHGPEITGCGSVSLYLIGRIAPGLGVFFPAFRLFSWYVLRRQSSLEARGGVWKPVLLLWAIVGPFVGLTAFLLVGDKLKERRLPVVDAQSFAGGLGAHPDLVDHLVRVRGVRLRDHAARCGCENKRDPKDCKVGALLVDLGAGGQVVVHAAGSDSADVFARGDGKIGLPVEAIGRLLRLPDPKEQPFNVRDCGWREFGDLPAAGRAYLEVEYP